MKVDVVYNKSCQRMTELPDNSIDMIMTSCPYWGLRNYGDDVKEIWGGDPDCEHKWAEEIHIRRHKAGETNPGKEGYTKNAGAWSESGGNFCLKCNAWHGQLGLEPTLEMYIEHLLLITLECKRVLKPTGVMWWNHGDSYFTGKGSCRNPGGGNKSWKSWNDRKGIFPRGKAAPNRMSKESPPKCLALQNYRLVIRMIDEQGWILRNDAIWNKPNGMPSSVKDRLANKKEPVFCLVKNTKPQYYWNEKTRLMADRKPSKAEQIEDIDWEWRECPKCNGAGKIIQGIKAGDDDFGIVLSEKGPEICPRCKGTGKIKHSYWHSLGYWYDLDAIREIWTDKRKSDIKRAKEKHPGYSGKYGLGYNAESRKILPGQGIKGQPVGNPDLGKNPGDVWTIPTQPRPEAHFATFPDKLCIKPILATCPAETCKKCGKARVRMTKYIGLSQKDGWAIGSKTAEHIGCSPTSSLITKQVKQFETIGWTDCGCNAGWESGVLLDPFAGRGTALIMAKKLGRHYIGYELKKEYCEELIKPALEEIDPLFNWKTPSPAAG